MAVARLFLLVSRIIGGDFAVCWECCVESAVVVDEIVEVGVMRSVDDVCGEDM